ncbi:MAG TPA: Lar family restriction alleviation protein [Patescibacteria group bacterium]|nr:Lar family restriction alleviation protein [Patescibacteria group bacterium]
MLKKQPKIKPCPFCKERATLIKDGMWYKINCDNIRCYINPFTHWGRIKASVIERWNIRGSKMRKHA